MFYVSPCRRRHKIVVAFHFGLGFVFVWSFFNIILFIFISFGFCLIQLVALSAHTTHRPKQAYVPYLRAYICSTLTISQSVSCSICVLLYYWNRKHSLAHTHGYGTLTHADTQTRSRHHQHTSSTRTHTDVRALVRPHELHKRIQTGERESCEVEEEEPHTVYVREMKTPFAHEYRTQIDSFVNDDEKCSECGRECETRCKKAIITDRTQLPLRSNAIHGARFHHNTPSHTRTRLTM